MYQRLLPSRRGVRRFCGLVAVVVLLNIPLVRAARAQAAAPTPNPSTLPSFHAGVDVVSLNVTVTGPDGHCLAGLDRHDFSVYEDGTRQHLEFFNTAHVPLTVALLLDTSASMDRRLATVQQAAIGFVRQLRPRDRAEVIDFDAGAQVLAPFTSNHHVLEQAILRTAAGGSTSLYDTLYVALHEITKEAATRPGQRQRQAIVLLSDGEDTSSLVTFKQVFNAAKRSDTAIYVVALRSRWDRIIEPETYDESGYLMGHLADQTGGQVFFPERLKDLSQVYGRIARRLSTQYALGYTSSDTRHDGTWRRIVVRVDRPGAVIHTKAGYYALIR